MSVDCPDAVSLKLAVCRAIRSNPAHTASELEQMLRRKWGGAWRLAHERRQLFLHPEGAGFVFPSEYHVLTKSA